MFDEPSVADFRASTWAHLLADHAYSPDDASTSREVHDLRVLAIVPGPKRSGAALYSSKLYRRLPAEILPGEGSFVRIVSNLLRRDANLYHIQFEYRGFGSFPRSLALLILLTLVLRLRGPVVITLHGLIVPESISKRRFGWLTYFVFFASVRLTGLFASAFIVHSELMNAILLGVYGIGKGVVIPCGTDADDVGPPRAEKPNRLVFYGFIRPSKGLENLIDALAIVRGTFPDTTLTIAGSLARPEEAEYLRYVQQRVQQQNLQNYVTFKDVPFIHSFSNLTERTRLMNDATTIVLPYTDRFIEVSAVVHDLAEYGIPIICSRTPRFSELVDEFDCLKVNPSPSNLAEAIIRILKNQELRSKLGANLRRKTQLESWDLVAQQHFSLYRKLFSRIVY